MKRHSLAQSVFKSACFSRKQKIYNFKIHLSSFSNTKQTNGAIFLNTTGDNFNLAKICWNMKVRLQTFMEITEISIFWYCLRGLILFSKIFITMKVSL